jgi:hypothetical protein
MAAPPGSPPDIDSSDPTGAADTAGVATIPPGQYQVTVTADPSTGRAAQSFTQTVDASAPATNAAIQAENTVTPDELAANPELNTTLGNSNLGNASFDLPSLPSLGAGVLGTSLGLVAVVAVVGVLALVVWKLSPTKVSAKVSA